MRELIKDRPNQVRHGIGNSSTPIDITALQGNAGGGQEGEVETPAPVETAVTVDLMEETSEHGDDDEEKGAEAEPSTVEPPGPARADSSAPAQKQKATPATASAAKPAPGSSTTAGSKKRKTESTAIGNAATPVDTKPAIKPSVTKKKKVDDQFSTVVVAEERTRQKELEAQKAHYDHQRTRVEVQGDLKREEIAMRKQDKERKHERKMAKLKFKHERKMLKYGGQTTNGTHFEMIEQTKTDTISS